MKSADYPPYAAIGPAHCSRGGRVRFRHVSCARTAGAIFPNDFGYLGDIRYDRIRIPFRDGRVSEMVHAWFFRLLLTHFGNVLSRHEGFCELRFAFNVS